MNAAGILALHYKSKFQDSLSSVYLHLVTQIASVANDQKLFAKALWWDAQICACGAYDETKLAIAKANSLLNFALKKAAIPRSYFCQIIAGRYQHL